MWRVAKPLLGARILDLWGGHHKPGMWLPLRPLASPAAPTRHAALRLARSLFGFAKAIPPGGTPPAVPKRRATRSAYGHEWQDDYSWLERPSRGVERVLQQEPEYFQAWMRDTGAQRTQQALLNDMLRLLPEEQVTPPERVGPYLYYVRQLPDQPHPCYLRRPAEGTGGSSSQGGSAEQVVLDVNELARVHGDSVAVGQVKLSRCSQHMALTLEAGDGSETFTGFTRDLRSGRLQQHPALGSVVSLEWAADGRTLLYTTPNELGRPSRVLRCDAGSSSPEGELVYEEQDERFFLELTRTKDWAFLALNANSKTSSEVRLIPSVQPGAAPWLVCGRREGVEYFVEHHSDRLLLLSNARGAEDYALYSTPAPPSGAAAEGSSAVRTSSDPGGWEVVLPEREGVAVEDMDVFLDAVVLYERHQGRPAVTVLPMGEWAPGGDGLVEAASKSYQVLLPDWALSISPGANADFHSKALRLTLSSPVHPDVIYDYGLPSRQLALVQPPAVQAHDPERYTCCVRWASSADGTPVPMTVAHARGLELDGSNPCLLVVYGAYGQCLPADFCQERIPLLERGWVVALAHVRGGGDLGRRWHAEGRGGNKARSVEDLEACLDALVTSGLTSHCRIALESLSAGGLTAGALLNRRPSAVAAALLEAPFVDVLTAMCDPGLPLTMHEYGEWGDPADPQAFRQLHQLCPYQNVEPAAYPATLVTCSQSDSRVPFWGPLKYAAKLRAAQQLPAAPVLLLPDAHEGHFAHESERYEIKSVQYAFLLRALGLHE